MIVTSSIIAFGDEERDVCMLRGDDSPEWVVRRFGRSLPLSLKITFSNFNQLYPKKSHDQIPGQIFSISNNCHFDDICGVYEEEWLRKALISINQKTVIFVCLN